MPGPVPAQSHELHKILTAQGVIAPLPHGDPFECFARGLDGVLARMGAACEAGNATLQGVGVAALEAVGKLGLAVASLQPFDHTPWSYAFSHYSVQVQGMRCLGGAMMSDWCLQPRAYLVVAGQAMAALRKSIDMHKVFHVLLLTCLQGRHSAPP